MIAIATGVLQYRLVARLQLPKAESSLLPTNAPAPELNAATPDGKTVQLSALAGKAVVVSFWASWCLPCRVEMPELAKFVQEWTGDKKHRVELVYLAVNFKDAAGVVRPLLKDTRYGGALFALDEDGKIAELWKVSAFPTTYVISPKGEILDAQVGYKEYGASRLWSVLSKLPQGAGGKNPS